MKRFALALTLLMAAPTLAQSKAACPYPASPINWILGYCANVVETDDEIAIQDSQCFKDAAPDLAAKDECGIKKKYKTKLCEKRVAADRKKFKSVADCLGSDQVKPFIAGG